MKRMIGFGDFMLRLNPPGYRRFLQAEAFERYYTGAEANVCASLSCLGVETDFVTRLPDHEIARCGIAELRKLGVGTRFIASGGERMGVFYLEKGASQRPSQVIYDRKYTSAATIVPGEFDWDVIFKEAGFFHFSGITPALGEQMPAVVKEACIAARRNGLFVSCDLNYRKNLWPAARAGEVMPELLQFIDLLIANEEDAEKVLGIKAADTDIEAGRLSPAGYRQVAVSIRKRFPNIRAVGISLRQSISASENIWGAMLQTADECCFSRNYDIKIVDRVGGGDSFAAGLIYAFGHGFSASDSVEFAAAASCLKHSIEQDVNLVSLAEVTRLMKGDASGRVQR